MLPVVTGAVADKQLRQLSSLQRQIRRSGAGRCRRA